MSIPTYRKFKKTDTDAVIKLWDTCKLVVPWNDPMKDIKRKLSIKDNLFVIAEINKKIIATAMAGYDGHRGYIYYLAVLPDLQKKGIGSSILSIIEKKLYKLGCPKINLWETCKLVVDWNDPLKDIKRKLSIKDNLFILSLIHI